MPKLTFTKDELIGFGATDVVAMNLETGNLRPISSTPLTFPEQHDFEGTPILLDISDRKLLAVDPLLRKTLWEEVCPFAETCHAQALSALSNGVLVFITLRQRSISLPLAEWWPHDSIVDSGRAEIVAADAVSGTILWRTPASEAPDAIRRIAFGGSHVLLITMSNIESFDAKTGKSEWKYDTTEGHPRRFIARVAPDSELTTVELTEPPMSDGIQPVDATRPPTEQLVYLRMDTGQLESALPSIGFVRFRRGNHILMGPGGWQSQYPVTCIDTNEEDVIWHREPGWLPYCIDDDAVYGLQLEYLDEAPFVRSVRMEAWSLKDGMTEWSVDGDYVTMHCLVSPRGDAQVAAVSQSGEVSFYRREEPK